MAQIANFTPKRTRHYYIVDVDSFIFYSSVTERSSIFGVDIVCTYLTDYIYKDDVRILLDKLRVTLIKGHEVCTLRIRDRLLMCKLKRISDRRIKIDRWDITGMGAEAFDLI